MNAHIIYGTAVYPGGRTIEINSKHPEWTDWAAHACNSHAALVESLGDMLKTYDCVDRMGCCKVCGAENRFEDWENEKILPCPNRSCASHTWRAALALPASTAQGEA